MVKKRRKIAKVTKRSDEEIAWSQEEEIREWSAKYSAEVSISFHYLRLSMIIIIIFVWLKQCD